MGIDFDERYSFLVVGDFLELHDLVVVVDGFFVKRRVEEIDDVLVGVSQVEDPRDLDVQILLVGLLALDALVDHMDFVVSFLLDLCVPFGKGLLQLCVAVLDVLSSVLHLFDPFLDRPAADCPPVDLIGDFFLLQELQEAFPLHVELQAAHNAIQREVLFPFDVPDALQGQ